MSICCSSFRAIYPQITHELCSKELINLKYQFTSKTPTFSSFQSKISYFSLISVRNTSSKSSALLSGSPVCLQPQEELPPKLQNIVKLFGSVQEPRAKYEQLLYYGKNLSPLANEFKTKENKVEGCVSQVWVRAYLDDKKNVWFEADSDSVLTKGLAALLVEGLSGNPLPDIVKVSPDFIQMLGLKQSLTPSRNNGFLNMLNLMQKKAVQLYMEEGRRVSDQNGGGDDLGGNGVLGSEETMENLNSSGNDFSGNRSDECGSNSIGRGERIRKKLERGLDPVELEVEDISHLHAGHMGVQGDGGETHFNVKVASEKFTGKSLLKRHRLVYDLLQEELQSGLHALSIVAKTPSEVDG